MKTITFGVLILSAFLTLSCSRGGSTIPDSPPTITGITPGTISGPSGTILELRLQATGPVDSYQWTFGPGAYPPMSTAATPSIRLTRPGTYEIRVTASNAAGQSLPLARTYQVHELDAPAWMGSSSPGTVGARMLESGGRPMRIDGIGDVRVQLADSPLPGSLDDWNSYVLSDDGASDSSQFAVVVTAQFICVLFEAHSMLRVAVTNIMPPNGVGDWTVTDVASIQLGQCFMTEHQGQLVIAAHRFPPYEWLLLRSDALPPRGPEDWLPFEDPGLSHNSGPILLNSTGELLEVVSTTLHEPPNQLAYFSAPGALPTINQWTRSVIADATIPVAIAHPPGRTYVVYHEKTPAFVAPLVFAHAASERPIGADQWTSYPLETGEAASVSFQLVDERPLILYAQDFGPPNIDPGAQGYRRLMGMRALTPDPTAIEDWQQTEILYSEGNRTFTTSAIELDGGISVSFGPGFPVNFLRTETLW